MSLSLRQVALMAGEPIEAQEVVETLAKLAVGRYRVSTGEQVVDGRTVGLLAKVLERLGWSPSELVILNNEEVDIALLVDRGLEEIPEAPFLPDAATLTLGAAQVLYTLELAENQGNLVGQCLDKAVKCHELLKAGIG